MRRARGEPLRVLVLNAGSSSLKFELIESAAQATRRLAAGSYAATDASGLFRWSGTDFSPRPHYYAYGLLTKFFRGPAVA